MLQNLITRTRAMLDENCSWPDAITWTTRKLPVNLRGYYAREIMEQICK